MTVMQDTNHVLNRIAFGPRPGDLVRIQDVGFEKYLDQQLHPDRIDDSATETRLANLNSLQMSTADLFDRYRPPRQARQLQMRPMFQNVPQQILQELQAQKVIRAVHSERQLQEVMTDFWFNHFNVFWGKNADRWLTTIVLIDAPDRGREMVVQIKEHRRTFGGRHEQIFELA